MARQPDPDSRPISMAELMARARENDETSQSGEGTGRRRRGGAGSVSFAELTGEIPRVADDDAAAGADAPPVEPVPEVAGDSQFVPTADEGRTEESRPSAPSEGLTSPRPFPRSEPPVPARDTETFRRSEVPIGRLPEPQADWSTPTPDSPPETSDPTTSERPTHPQTRDISSAAIGERFRSQPRPDDDSVETGIIPRVGADDAGSPRTGSLDGADLDHLSRAERERAFESYRNFEDIDDTEVPEQRPKSRRGLFGGLRRNRPAQARDDRDDTPDQDTPRQDTHRHDDARARDGEQPQPGGDEFWTQTPWSRWPTDDAAETDPARTVGREMHDQLRDSGDFDFANDRLGIRHPDFVSDARPERSQAERSPFDRADTDRVDHDVDDRPTDETRTAFGVAGSFTRDDDAPSAAPHRRRRRDDDAETGVVDLDRAHRGPDTTADDPDAITADEQAGPSPTRQWVMLGVQVVVGLLLGVGLFLGFTELWRWNVYFALVLAIVVIFAMVTTVHVVRRSQDLISTLLALGVGLIVTIGPLVLLASGS